MDDNSTSEQSDPVKNDNEGDRKNDCERKTSTKSEEPVENLYEREQRFLGGMRLIVTVEPILFMLTAIGSLISPSVTQFFRQEICYMLFNVTYCTDMLANSSEFPLQYAEVDGMVTQYSTYSMLLSSVPAIFVSWIMGNWSDTISRKFVLTICLVSNLVQLAINFAVMQFSDTLPFQVILLSSFVSGLTGGISSYQMAVYGYMGQLVTTVNCEKAAANRRGRGEQEQPLDENDEQQDELERVDAQATKGQEDNCLQQRTSRYAVLESMIFLGAAMGVFFSGLLASAVGYAYTQLVGFALMLLTFVYMLLWVIDFRPKLPVQLSKLSCYDLFAVSNLADTMRCVYKERPGILRQQLLLSLTSMFLFGVAVAGEAGILYLYLTSPPFNFSMTLYGYFAGYDSIASWMVLCFGLPLLKFAFPLIEDTIYVLISAVFRLVGLLYLAFITTQLEVFLVGLFEMFQGWQRAILRVLMSLSVPVSEQGKIFAIVASGQNIFGIATSFLFSYWIYPATVTTFPGCTLVVGAAILIIPLGEVAYLMYLRLKYKAYSEVNDT